MKTKISHLLVSGCLLLSSLPVFAGDMMVRMRAINVMPDESGTPSVVKGDVKLNNASVPEIDFSYFFNENFALELILATTTHKASVHKAAGNTTSIDLGDVSLLPPTLTAQYHHEFGNFKPYVGAGLNYTIFYGADTGDMRSVKYENSFGYALQVGGDYKIAENTYLNFDIKKLYLSTDVEVKDYNGTKVTADVDIDPWIIGLGVGYRF